MLEVMCLWNLHPWRYVKLSSRVPEQSDLIGPVLIRELCGSWGAFSNPSYSMNFYGRKYVILCSHVTCKPNFLKFYTCGFFPVFTFALLQRKYKCLS